MPRLVLSLSPLPDPIHITPLNSLAVGDAFDSDQIIDSLLQSGYTKEPFVALPGQFAVRGSVMDIFLTSNKDPIRIEHFGFQVESLRTFNAESQITNEKIEKLDLLPSYEFPINEKSSENFKREWRKNFEVFEEDSDIFSKIMSLKHAEGSEIYYPMFYGKKKLLS